jgi:hypothetical protein
VKLQGENQAHGLPLDCFKSTPTPYHMLLVAQLRLGQGVTLPCHGKTPSYRKLVHLIRCLHSTAARMYRGLLPCLTSSPTVAQSISATYYSDSLRPGRGQLCSQSSRGQAKQSRPNPSPCVLLASSVVTATQP